METKRLVYYLAVPLFKFQSSCLLRGKPLAFQFVPMFGIVTKSYRKRSICVPGASTGSTIGESAAIVRYAAKYAIGHSTDVILLVLLVDMLLVMLLDIYICIYLYL
jgi:hypothetical protein